MTAALIALLGGIAAVKLFGKKKGVSGVGMMRRDDWNEYDKPEQIHEYGEGEYGRTVKKFCLDNDVKLFVLADTYGYYFPDDKQMRPIYKLKLTRGNKSYTFTFGDAVVATGYPSVYDVLASLTKYPPINFGWFCSEYGYEQWDEYGRKKKEASKVYKAVDSEYDNVKRLFGDVIEDLQEIQ